MNRTLGLVALSGLGIGVVCLSLAWAIGGRDFRTMIAEDRFGWRSCDDARGRRPARTPPDLDRRRHDRGS